MRQRPQHHGRDQQHRHRAQPGAECRGLRSQRHQTGASQQLGRADDGEDRRQRGRRNPLGGEQRDEVKGDAGKIRRAGGEPQRQPQPDARAEAGGRRCVACRFGMLNRIRPAVPVRDEQRMQDHRNRKVDRGQTEHRLTPPEQLDEQLRAGNEDRPGKAAEQRDCPDGAPEVQRLPLGDDREGRLVEDEGLRHPHQNPGGHELPGLIDGGPRQDRDRHAKRTDGHGQAAAMPLHPETRQRRANRLGDQAERRGHVGCRPRPAEFTDHRVDHERESIERRAPGNQLAYGKCEDQHPAPPWCGVPAVVVGIRSGSPVSSTATGYRFRGIGEASREEIERNGA